MPKTDDEAEYEACRRFVAWLGKSVVHEARGDNVSELKVAPGGRFWLGRLAPEDSAIQAGASDRGERLDPCAVGMIVQPARSQPLKARVRASAWLRREKELWTKSAAIDVTIDLRITGATQTHGARELGEALSVVGAAGLLAEVRTEIETNADGREELTLYLVNTSPARSEKLADTNLYECSVEVGPLATVPFLLESLPDTFRYDRRVPGYGINCGLRVDGDKFLTSDDVSVDRGRPTYWSAADALPDLSFKTLSEVPLPSLSALVGALERWGGEEWGDANLAARSRAEGWSTEMFAEARRGAEEFGREVARVRAGLALLQEDARLLKAFRLMNASMVGSSRGRFPDWRPFQIGFVLANIRTLVEPAEADIADIVWFATGGGKTETYLGIVVTAAFYDRLRGKRSGITAWNRFPLRMLSLQQTQRFADAMAAAELVRRAEGIDGDMFSVGFLVGKSSTPNSIPASPKKGDPDRDDIDGKYKILLRCPYCHGDAIDTRFEARTWTLQHRCSSENCPGGSGPIPFYIVDDEIYRFLPTVVVGTLDKAASIAIQASMRGFVGAPRGRCSRPGHGFTYAVRGEKPTGCLVPGCKGPAGAMDQDGSLYAPTLRLQDELHLLKDSLGAVDAHYEALLDHLQLVLSGRRAKVLGSSATLAGYEKQVEVLYARRGRVFPAPGPSATKGFWTSESDRLARRFVALAPRGVTTEYALDQSVTSLQKAVRRLHAEPVVVCREAEIDPEYAPMLLNRYGVDVVYGNTLRDLDAVVRSFETQIKVEGTLRTASLTGRTPFDEVRETLEKLDRPEDDFDDRLHVVAASAMMSHGVDIDRLNVMVMMGLPLTTAEFIQTSSRVGRRYPGIVFVLPKIARERDASVYRSFEHFVKQGDRLVEPIAIGRRSRRVLDRTLPGMALARVLHVHEPNATKSIVMISHLRDYLRGAKIGAEDEARVVATALGFDGPMEADLRRDLHDWFDDFFSNLDAPPAGAKFANQATPTRPMISLRDVEEQAPIVGFVK